MNLRTFKIRASQSGKLMGQKGLGETGKTYCKEWLIKELYGVEKEIFSKYLDNGINMEPEAIRFYEENRPQYFGLEKNTLFFEDDYFTGTPDLILDSHVIDIKCSFSPYTFPLFDDGQINKDYYIQGQVYMHLTGKTKYKLVYVLMNQDYDFDSIPADLRIKEIEFDYNDEIIEKLQSRVLECREIIKDLYDSIRETIKL